MTPAEALAAAAERAAGLRAIRGLLPHMTGEDGRWGLLSPLDAAAPNPVKAADAKLARVLEEEEKLVRLGDGMAVSAEAYARARAVLVEECSAAGRITLARFRDLLGIGRRSAQLLLERFDADGLTRRVGDERVLRRAARS